MLDISYFDSPDEGAVFVASIVKTQLEADIDTKSGASLVLTGGTGIRNFLPSLSKMEIAWNKVWVTLSDERWCSVEHLDSNERQLKELFLQKVGMANFIGLKTKHAMPVQALSDIQKNIDVIPVPYSCVVLSVGEDGHVASIFSENAKDWFQTGMLVAKGFNSARVSFSLKQLNNCILQIALIKKERSYLLNQEEKSLPFFHLKRNCKYVVY